MLPSLGVPELVIILVIIVIIFGVGRLPEIGGAIGKGIREFRTAQNEIEETVKEEQATESETSKD